MNSTERHPRTVRLLKLAAAAVVLASAFADAAQADVGLTGSQGAPSAPVSSAVTGVSTTVTATLDAATTSTDDTLGDAQASAAGVPTTLDATVDETVGQVQSTLDAAVDDTVGPVRTTLDATVDNTLSAVGETANQITGTTSSVGESADQVTAPLTSTLGLARSTASSPVPPVVSNVSPTALGTPGSVIAPTLGTMSSPAAVVGVGLPPTLHADPSLATPRPHHARWDTAAVPLGFGPAFAALEGGKSSVTRTTPVPQPPGRHVPAIPADPLSALLQGPDGGGLLVMGALLGLVALLLAGGTGARLRPVADLLRPPDVFFHLERPG